MRRISTLAIAFFAIVISQNVSGQTCTFGTTPPAIVPGTTNPFNAGAEGFTGDFSYGSNMLTSTTGAGGKTLISPIYYINPGTNFIYVKADLDRNGSATITGVTVTATTNTNPAIAVCSQTGLSISPTSPTTYYLTLPTTNIPFSKNFRLNITFTISQNSIDLDNFGTTALDAGTGATLPVRISSIAVSKEGNGAKLVWNVDTEENVANYQVERSSNGNSFSKIGTVSAAGARSYSFTDNAPLTEGYYRVKAVDNDGKFGLSTIVKLKGGKSGIVLRAYPMPAQNSVTIEHSTAASASRITVSSQDGRMVKSIIPSAGVQKTNVDLSSLTAGMYLVRFDAGNGEVETLKIVKQ